MGFIALKCPSCGAEIQMDNSREFGFCQYCGTKIVQDKMVVEHKGRVGVDHSDEIKNLLMRANENFKMGNSDLAEQYYNRVLDMDFDNLIARQALQKIYKIIKEPNLSILVSTTRFYNKNARVSVKIDGQKRGEILNGQMARFTLNVGCHEVILKIASALGSPKKIFNVNIENRFTKVDLNALCKAGSKIEVTRI